MSLCMKWMRTTLLSSLVMYSMLSRLITLSPTRSNLLMVHLLPPKSRAETPRRIPRPDRARTAEEGCPYRLVFLMYRASRLVVLVYIRNTLRHGTGAKRRPRCGSSEVGNNATNNTSIIEAGAPARRIIYALAGGGCIS